VKRYRRPQPYEEIDHTADAGVTVRGATAEEALARLVLAYSDLITGGGELAAGDELVINVDPGDRAAMAIDVLRELLYRFDCERRIPESVEVRRFDPELGTKVFVSLGIYDAELHREGLELKAVTFHAARFEPEGDGWLAEVVFDV